MMTKSIIEEITHDDLVNLLSTATYGSNYLTCKIPKGNYKGTEMEDENDCVEDKWAKVLLAGKELYVYDYYAEDEDDFYGNLPHKWDENKEAMRYTITLEDIKKGAQKALDADNKYDRKFMNDWMNEEGDFDFCEADALMQLFAFGETVYG